MPVKFENLVELCEQSCRTYADRQLFGVKQGATWTWITYAEFRELVDAFRGGLRASASGRGDKVAIIADNRVEWAVACYATYGLGAASCRCTRRSSRRSGTSSSRTARRRSRSERPTPSRSSSAQMRGELPSLQHVIGLELPASDDHSYAALLEVGRQRPVPRRVAGVRDDVAGLIYTSGTTGIRRA